MLISKKSTAMALWVLCFLSINSISVFAQNTISAFNFDAESAITEFAARSTSDDEAVQSWPITINNQLRDLDEGINFNVPLPSGGLVTAVVSNRIEFDNGDVQLIAVINGGGRIVITMGDEVVFGSINNEAFSYSIGLNANQEIQLVDNQSVLSEVDLSGDMRYPPTTDAESRTAHTAHSLEDLERLSAQNTGESTIDLLVVYSSEFGSLFSSAETRINQLISFTNTSFADSGILINLRLAAAVELEFNNGNSVSTHLNDATDGVGDFTSLPQIRNQYGADLVAILSANTSNAFSANGIAWVNGDNPNRAFSATRLSTNCCDSVFAHEIGHNLGSGHEYSSVNPNLPSTNECDTEFTFTEYSCGYGNYISSGNNNNWGTIMSNFSNKANIGYLFSNTDNDCLGLPCGVAEGNFKAADNRSSFNMSRLLVADFRDEVEPTIPPTTPSEFDMLLYLPAIIFHTIDDD